MHDFIQVCVQLDVVHGCMHGACMRVCVFMIACASQIHDVLVNDMVPVGILVTEHFDNRWKHLEYVIISLFCPASFSNSLLCAEINSQEKVTEK